jgi:hypothetical protein
MSGGDHVAGTRRSSAVEDINVSICEVERTWAPCAQEAHVVCHLLTEPCEVTIEDHTSISNVAVDADGLGESAFMTRELVDV